MEKMESQDGKSSNGMSKDANSSHGMSKDAKSSNGLSQVGIIFCWIQIVSNIIPSAILLSSYGGLSIAIKTSASFAIALFSISFAAGIAAFNLRSVFISCMFSLYSVSVAAVVSSLYFATYLNISSSCSVNQISYKGCNNFSTTYCAIDNACTEELLVDSSCDAPVVDLCRNIDKICLTIITAAVLAIVFSISPACIAFYNALIFHTPSKNISVGTAVNPIPHDPCEDFEKFDNSIAENSKAVSVLREAISNLEKQMASQEKQLVAYGRLMGVNDGYSDQKKKKKKKSKRSSESFKNGNGDESMAPQAELSSSDPFKNGNGDESMAPQTELSEHPTRENETKLRKKSKPSSSTTEIVDKVEPDNNNNSELDRSELIDAGVKYPADQNTKEPKEETSNDLNERCSVMTDDI